MAFSDILWVPAIKKIQILFQNLRGYMIIQDLFIGTMTVCGSRAVNWASIFLCKLEIEM
jgi:hypothetical protein